MYYYLDQDDGYTRGPYSWNELKQLPLLPGTFIFDKPRRRWRTFYQYQAEMAADAGQKVVQRTRSRQPVSVAGPVAEPTISEPRKPQKQPVLHLPESKKPEFVPPMLPPFSKGAPAMGISGVGCFIAAVLFVLVVIGFLVFVGS